MAHNGRLLSVAERYLECMAVFSRQVDSSEWPLAVVVPSAFGSKDSLEALTQDLGTLLDREEPFCILCDMSHKSCMDLPEVQHLQLFFTTQGRRLDAQVDALAFAVPSAMVRGAVRLVLEARPPHHPFAVLRERREALRYLRAYLEPSGSSAAAVAH